MADNYLERQREQYEARKAAWEKTRHKKKRKIKTISSSNTAASSPIHHLSEETDKPHIK